MIRKHGKTVLADLEAGVEKRCQPSLLRVLHWLREQQNADGSWGDTPRGKSALAGMCILLFLSHGEGEESNQFRDSVERGLKWLSAEFSKPRGLKDVGMPADTIAALCLLEHYVMTRRDKDLPQARQCLERIATGDDSSFWRLLALKTAARSGLDSGAVKKAIESVQTAGARAMTGAVAAKDTDTIARLLLAKAMWAKKPGSSDELGLLPEPDASLRTTSSSGWPLQTRFLETCLRLFVGGETWDCWNKTTMKWIIGSQNEDGEWDYSGRSDCAESKYFSDQERRLYASIMAGCPQAAYYRYLAFLAPPEEQQVEQK